MKPKDRAAGAHRGDNCHPSLCYRIIIELLFPFLVFVIIFYIFAAVLVIIRACQSMGMNEDNASIASSAQLVGVKGLEPALAPEAASPAFDLLVRVDNGHNYDLYREGGGVTVSYAGVPLARGRTPSFRVGAKSALSFTVNATTEAVGVAVDLFPLLSAERRWGAAQLDVRMQLGWPGWESYAWSIDLDGQPGTSA
ncbi:unnamed protein product [Urochloa decumbens]|uniref:Late embryogenesis abundant protein LEA-2 subgroup domain-containing protein n=1 Tax=Urochloa decumbens TaxID=240449 RepID=A0ABC8ZKL5_9POAL